MKKRTPLWGAAHGRPLGAVCGFLREKRCVCSVFLSQGHRLKSFVSGRAQCQNSALIHCRRRHLSSPCHLGGGGVLEVSERDTRPRSNVPEIVDPRRPLLILLVFSFVKTQSRCSIAHALRHHEHIVDLLTPKGYTDVKPIRRH